MRFYFKGFDHWSFGDMNKSTCKAVLADCSKKASGKLSRVCLYNCSSVHFKHSSFNEENVAFLHQTRKYLRQTMLFFR